MILFWGQKMTDEERRKLLVSQLRGRDADSAPANDFLCVDAADEIERLSESLKASHGYSDECHKRIKCLNDQIDAMLTSPTLVQSDAEPVAWHLRERAKQLRKQAASNRKYGDVLEFFTAADKEDYAASVLEELAVSAPPRADASAEPRVTLDEIEAAMDRVLERRGFQTMRPDASAGLIEAAEWHEELAKEKLEQAKRASEDKKRRFLDISFFHDECASALRTRAADRSEK